MTTVVVKYANLHPGDLFPTSGLTVVAVRSLLPRRRAKVRVELRDADGHLVRVEQPGTHVVTVVRDTARG